jgi:hypothetical protein
MGHFHETLEGKLSNDDADDHDLPSNAHRGDVPPVCALVGQRAEWIRCGLAVGASRADRDRRVRLGGGVATAVAGAAKDRGAGGDRAVVLGHGAGDERSEPAVEPDEIAWDEATPLRFSQSVRRPKE